jgi:hypothetical protein
MKSPLKNLKNTSIFPKSPQKHLKNTENGPKTPQNWVKWPQKCRQTRQKSAKTAMFSVIAARAAAIIFFRSAPARLCMCFFFVLFYSKNPLFLW